MPTEVKKEIELEIAYVLLCDIVVLFKLVTSEQRRLLELLNQIVRKSEHFRTAGGKRPSNHRSDSDGMALVFYNTPEAPVECALEVNRAASEHPELKLRMGIHSGPVSGVVDREWSLQHSGSRNQHCAAGDGICGRMPVTSWCPNTWPKTWNNTVIGNATCTIWGECEVKHGFRVSVVNLYTEDHGNPECEDFRQARKDTAPWLRKVRHAGLLPSRLF